jgi:hypothetical protein
MRGLRSLLILLVIAIALGWFAYRDYQRPPDTGGPERDKVFAVEADQIDSITVRSEAGEETRLQRSGDEWQIVSPITARPDTGAVSGLTSNLSTLEIQRVVDESPPDLGEYALDSPRVQVSFTAQGTEHTLLLGGRTPPGTDLYAKRASDDAVFLVASYLESTFDRSTFDLRDKAVLNVEHDKLDAVEIASAGRTLRFVRPAGEWQIASPIEARADYSMVDSLVRRLAGLQMTAIVEEEPKDLRKYGLDRPAASVRLGSGSSQASLVLGSPAGNGDNVYAKDVSRAPVVSVASSVLEELKKDAAEFRQKDLFDARAFNATRLEIQREGQTHTFEKATVMNEEGQEEERWRQTSPQARDVDASAFDSLLSAVTRLRADSFVAAAPARVMAKPHMTIDLRSDEGKRHERVTVARTGEDAYATRDGEAGAARLPTTAIESIDTALQELK